MQNTIYVGVVIERGQALESAIALAAAAYRRRFELEPNVARVNPADLAPVAVAGIAVEADPWVRRRDVLVGQEVR